MSKIIGIDLGTTNSCVSIIEWGQTKVVPNAEGGRTTPSIVANKKGETIVGTAAKRQAVSNPSQTIFSAKRYIGRKFDEVQNEIKNAPFKVVKGSNGECLIEFNGKNVRPEEISAKVLEKLKEDSEKFLGEKITDAIITVPAYFNDDQRQATINAWKIAGLNVLRIINEPTAAALSYWFDKKKDEKIAVYDFWGGTFDISILEIWAEGTFEVLATNWDTHLGGDDFDQRIYEWVISEFKKDQGIDLSKDPAAVQRIRDEAEKAKKELSSATETEINLPYITIDSSGPKNLFLKLTRAKLEELIYDLVEKSIAPCKKAMKDSGLKLSDIDEVLLVWGSTRVPLVLKKIEDFFGKKPNSSVNPDEAVAIWAAIQGGILGGDVKDILLLDVTPLSLGIETLGWVCTRMIDRNTTIPFGKSQIYSTAQDGQTSVEIHVLQWEREFANDNKSLGKFHLDGIVSAPRGVPQIEVTFDIDASWILHVTAKDKWSGKEQKITISGSTSMNSADVDNLVKEAELHREEDKRKKDKIESNNMAESLIYQSEKTIKDNEWKFNSSLSSEANGKIEELKNAMADLNCSTEEIKQKTEDLNQVMMKIWQEIYSQGQSQNSGDTNNSSANESKDYVDAEVE